MPDGLRVADRRRRPDSGHGDDEVGVHRVLRGEPAAHLDPGGVHGAAGDRGVGPGEVDVLEDAPRGLRGREREGAQAGGVDGDQLAGLDLADDGGADDVERGGLAGDDPAALEPAEHERTDAARVAGRVERVLVHEDEAEGAPQLRQHLEGGRLEGAVRRSPRAAP